MLDVLTSDRAQSNLILTVEVRESAAWADNDDRAAWGRYSGYFRLQSGTGLIVYVMTNMILISYTMHS